MSNCGVSSSCLRSRSIRATASAVWLARPAARSAPPAAAALNTEATVSHGKLISGEVTRSSSVWTGLPPRGTTAP